jgi:ribosomal protein L5
MKFVLTNPSNRIRYFYENILRYDLLLKLNYNNIMQVPQIAKIIIQAYGVPYKEVQNASLAIEIIGGQKVSCIILPDLLGLHSTSFRPAKKNWRRSHAAGHSGKGRSDSRRGDRHLSILQSQSTLLYCSLRARTMYNFLEKLISLPSLAELESIRSNDSKIQIQGQEVQITLSNRELRMFPEIQNHFEFFESLHTVQIKVITSARNEEETRLLWTGLQQKEI